MRMAYCFANAGVWFVHSFDKTPTLSRPLSSKQISSTLLRLSILTQPASSTRDGTFFIVPKPRRARVPCQGSDTLQCSALWCINIRIQIQSVGIRSSLTLEAPVFGSLWLHLVTSRGTREEIDALASAAQRDAGGRPAHQAPRCVSCAAINCCQLMTATHLVTKYWPSVLLVT